MSKGGGSSTTTSRNELDPFIKEQVQKNLSLADTIAEKPYEPYTGERIEGFSDPQAQAQQMALDRVNNGTMGQSQLNQAQQYLTGAIDRGPQNMNAASYNPAMAQSNMLDRSQIQDIGVNPIQNAQLFAQQTALGTAAQANANQGQLERAQQAQVNRGDIREMQGQRAVDYAASYANPYEDQVVNAALGDIESARKQAIQKTQDQAIGQGAFGGSRAGVTEALTNQTYADQAARTAAQLRSQGFNQAMTMGSQDASNAQNAMGQNMSADQAVTMQNAGFGQQTNLTNAGASNNMSQFNASAQNANSQFNAGNRQQMELANMGAVNQTNASNAAAANQNAQFNANLGLQNNSQAMQAQQTNQAMDYQTMLANQQAGNQFNLANQSALNQAGVTNAGFTQQANMANQQAGQNYQQLMMQGANMLPGLGAQQRAFSNEDINMLNSVGGQQQAMGQMQRDLDYANFVEARDEDIRDLDLRLRAIGQSPYGSSQTTTQPVNRNMAAGGLGGALAGAQLAGMVPALGPYAGVAAGIGGLLGAFG